MKKGDTITLKDGRKGEVVCPGFIPFIALNDGNKIYLSNHSINTYTKDLNHKKDPNLSVVSVNGEKVIKLSLEEKIGIMSNVGKKLAI